MNFIFFRPFLGQHAYQLTMFIIKKHFSFASLLFAAKSFLTAVPCDLYICLPLCPQGVNPLQIQMEMRNHGLDPDILEDEEAELPDSEQGQGGVGGARADNDKDSEVGTTASSSSSEASDDSFESD